MWLERLPLRQFHHMAMSRRLITAAVGIALAVPTPGHACSKIGYHYTRSATKAHFIGTSTGDTAFAGGGSVQFVVAPGHSGPAGQRAVYGQVVSVESIGGLASRALRQPVRRVVLVPWDYAADCTTTPWMRSAAWVEPGTRGLFTGVLRDSAHWAGGVPTFDVFAPETEPYPHGVLRLLRGLPFSADTFVPIEELFQLTELFPEQRLLPDSAEAATAELFAWARANPTLALRYPIAGVLWLARDGVRTQRLRAIESPLTGTYEMTVTLSGAPARTFYARTRGVPQSEWDVNRSHSPRIDDPTFVPRPDGYYLLTAVARSVAALPDSCEQGLGADRDASYIAVVNSPPDSAADAGSWTGKLEVHLVTRAFVGDSALRRFARVESNVSYERYRAGLPAETPARFARSADGAISVEQRITLADGRWLGISGTRISPDTVACPY